MLASSSTKPRTEYINSLVPTSPATVQKPFESEYGSSHSTVDERRKFERAHTAKHHRQTPLLANRNRLLNVFDDTYPRDPVSNSAVKQQRQSSNDPTSDYLRPKTTRSRISIDTKPFQDFKSMHQKHNDIDGECIHSRRSDILKNPSRYLQTPPEKESNVGQYSDDWDSDYSDDWELETCDIPKPTAVLHASRIEAELVNDSTKFIPSDPGAFNASLYQKRQSAIDNMSYRQAVNSWKAKALHDVVNLILHLSSGKSLIDRAWIVFYWVSQNIEYDVEAYFSGNSRHQTSEDVFANRKGVCDAFGTIFETLCNAVDIECKKVGGYAKGYGYSLEQTTFKRPDHAWNAIRLDGHWYLVDPTWGEGHLDANSCNHKELNSFYFLVRPEHMIYRHLPENPQWQLLKHHVSMEDFVRLPFVHPTFFELQLDIVSPSHSNAASFNSILGLAEVLIRAPADTVLIGDIKEGRSDRTKTNCLVQYDADRRLWQCLFAPSRGGFHTLAIFGLSSKNATAKRSYSCAVELSLQVSSDFRGKKTFPKTYGLFEERKCQIFEPLDGTLKPGSQVTIHCRIPGAYCGRLRLDDQWLSKNLLKDGIFKRQITVPQREIVMYVQFTDKQNTSHYDGLFCYSLY